MNRWEERLQNVFKVMPYSFKDELFRMLVEKMQHPLKAHKSEK
jgi:tRNA A37 threonylcarbamoyltransferase TsaD